MEGISGEVNLDGLKSGLFNGALTELRVSRTAARGPDSGHKQFRSQERKTHWLELIWPWVKIQIG